MRQKMIIHTEGETVSDSAPPEDDGRGLVETHAESLDEAIRRALEDARSETGAAACAAELKADGLKVAKNLGGVFTGETTLASILGGLFGK